MGRMKDISIRIEELEADNEYLRERIRHLTKQLEKLDAYYENKPIQREDNNQGHSDNGGTVLEMDSSQGTYPESNAALERQ